MYTNQLVMIFFMVFITACSPTKKNSQDLEPQNDSKAIQGKVLATLLEGESPEQLEKDFSKYALDHLAVASKSLNQHLFSFNMSKISTEDLLKKLNKSKIVFQADPLKQEYQKPQLKMSAPKKKVEVK